MPAALALLVSAASLGLARSQPQLFSASKVCVKNEAGFMMTFELWNTANNMVSRMSPSYGSPGEQCLDLWSLGGVEPGTPVVAIVHAGSGMTSSLGPVLYSPASGGEGAATASFACKGSSRGFSCTMNGEAQEVQPGALLPQHSSQAVSAKGVCVENTAGFTMRIRLWDTATGAFGAWSKMYYSDASECVDGGSLGGVASGHPLVLQVSPQGAYPASFLSVLYDPDATASAQFVCSGATAGYDCKLQASRRLRGVLV